MRAEASKGNIRGARAWKRVQVYAAGLTQNRRAELQSKLNTFKRAAVVLPKWERKVCDWEVKMDFFLKIIPTSLQQFTSALVSTGRCNYEKLRRSKQLKTARRRAVTKERSSTRKSSRDGHRRGVHGADYGPHPQPQLSVEHGSECDAWKDWKDDGTSELLDGGGMCRMGIGGSTSMGLAIIAINMATLGDRCPKKTRLP